MSYGSVDQNFQKPWVESPVSVPLVGAAVSFVVMLGFRVVVRSQREGAVRPRTGQRTLVFGAGDGGHQLIRSMLGSTDSPYLPVGLLDDDPDKRHVRIRGVRMLGNREQLAASAAIDDDTYRALFGDQ